MKTLIKLELSVVLTLIIKSVVSALHYSISWWLAALIALVAVFSGQLIIPSNKID